MKDANKDSWPTIWSGGVKPSDYPSKKHLIDSKKAYYQGKYDKAVADNDNYSIQKYKKNLEMVNEFEAAGKIYEAAVAELEEAKNALKPFEDAKKAKEAAKAAKEKAKLDAKKAALKKDIEDLGGKTYDLSFIGFPGDVHASLADYEKNKKIIKEFKKYYGSSPYFTDEMKVLNEFEKDLKAQKKAQAALDKLNGVKKSDPDALFTNPDPKKTIANAKDFSYDHHERENFDWATWNALKHEERNGLQRYTGSSYGAMNDIMRGKRAADPRNASLINGATDAVSHFKLKEDTKLYRGMGSDRSLARALGLSVDDVRKMLDDGSIVGQVFTEDGFGSTAATKRKAWNKEIMLDIYAPEGTQAMYVDPVSLNSGEKEILLQRGTRFEVLEVTKTSNPWGGEQYWLKVVILDQKPKKF